MCHNVGTEPQLQPLSGEQLTLQSANREEGTRLDIAADDFWGGDRNRAFFDVRVFGPFAQSHWNTSLSQCYKKNEREKRRVYDQCFREVDHGSFSPLVFSTAGGMGPTASVVYKRIASMLAQKCDQSYSKTLYWIRCKLSYSLLRSAIMCLRGVRSSIHHPAASPETMDLACQESRVPLQSAITVLLPFFSPFYTSNTYHFHLIVYLCTQAGTHSLRIYLHTYLRASFHCSCVNCLRA